jgi:hypothetical protein
MRHSSGVPAVCSFPQGYGGHRWGVAPAWVVVSFLSSVVLCAGGQLAYVRVCVAPLAHTKSSRRHGLAARGRGRRML